MLHPERGPGTGQKPSWTLGQISELMRGYWQQKLMRVEMSLVRCLVVTEARSGRNNSVQNLKWNLIAKVFMTP